MARSPFELLRRRMLWLSGFFVIALGCAPQASSPATTSEPVTFLKMPPKIGRSSTEEHWTELRIDTEAQAEGRGSSRVRVETSERERKREQVLATFDRIVTKKRTSYELVERREVRNGIDPVVTGSVLAGHTYVAEMKQSVPIFTDERGLPVSDRETKELARRLGNFGKPDPFLEGIPDGPLYPGGSAAGMAGGFLEAFEATEEGAAGADIAHVDVHFAGTRDTAQGKCGVFAVKLTVQMAGEPPLSMDLQGEFLVRVADSAPVALDVRGPVRVTGIDKVEGYTVKFSGAGEIRGGFRVSYVP